MEQLTALALCMATLTVIIAECTPQIIVGDGQIPCTSVPDVFVPVPVHHPIRILNTVNHVTFSGCSWATVNVVLEIDTRRTSRHHAAERRLLIEVKNTSLVGGALFINGTHNNFVTDVDLVAESVEFSRLGTDAISIIGGNDTLVADVTITVNGTSSSKLGWGRFATIVAGRVQRATIAVSDNFTVSHTEARFEISDTMLASVRSDPVECVELRMESTGLQLVAKRGFAFSGALTDAVHATVAAVVPLTGSEIRGNSVTIFFNVTAEAISVGTVGLTGSQLGVAVVGGVAAIARTPLEKATIAITNLRIVATGSMEKVAAAYGSVNAIFGVAAHGGIGVNVDVPGLVLGGHFGLSEGPNVSSVFEIDEQQDGAAIATFGVAATSADKLAFIRADAARIAVASTAVHAPVVQPVPCQQKGHR